MQQTGVTPYQCVLRTEHTVFIIIARDISYERKVYKRYMKRVTRREIDTEAAGNVVTQSQPSILDVRNRTRPTPQNCGANQGYKVYVGMLLIAVET